MTPDEGREFEINQIERLLNNMDSARSSMNKVKAAEELFAFLLTTRYVLQSDKFRSAIINKIEDFQTVTHISPRLQNLLMATRQYITNFE